ncbi:hypothetical protein [Desulfocastanea catecholica]
MKKNTIFVGLDVHKNSIDVAMADDGRDGVGYNLRWPISIIAHYRKLHALHPELTGISGVHRRRDDPNALPGCSGTVSISEIHPTTLLFAIGHA